MTRYEWVLARKAENFPVTAACEVAEVPDPYWRVTDYNTRSGIIR